MRTFAISEAISLGANNTYNNINISNMVSAAIPTAIFVLHCILYGLTANH